VDLPKLESIKDLGGALAGLAALSYASGYFILRSRAHALGIDSSAQLLDAAYIFAGFRFLLEMLLAALLVLPVAAGLRTLASVVLRAAGDRLGAILQWSAVVIFALLVLAQIPLLEVNAVLLDHPAVHGDSMPTSSYLVDAVLGRNNLGIWLVLATTLLAMLAAQWFRRHDRVHAPKGLASPLALLVALQMLFMPVSYGIFFTDRSVRVLDGVPKEAQDLGAPVGIVDLGGDYLTLLGANREGSRRLVLVARSDLKGLAVRQIVPLQSFLETISPGPQVGSDPPAKPPTSGTTSAGTGRTNDSFWKAAVNYLKTAFENLGSLSEGKAEAGQIWVVEVDGTQPKGAAHGLSVAKDLSWPVVGDGGAIYALKDGAAVRLSQSGIETPLAGSTSAWEKLIGVNADGSILGIVRDPPFGRVAILGSDGTLAVGVSPSTAEERQRQALLLQETRSYADGRSLAVRSSTRGRGVDVYIAKKGKQTTDLSDCGDDFCGQPSLSPDGTRVTWIRSSPP
jgi:hypothetical protein